MRRYLAWLVFFLALIGVADAIAGHGRTRGHRRSVAFEPAVLAGGGDVCGDGAITGAEACDDGDTDNGDGCSSTCTIETDCSCQGEPSTCFCDSLSVQFDGVNEYATCGDLAIVDSATALTVCWWFRWVTVPASGVYAHWGKFNAVTTESPIHSELNFTAATFSILTRSTSRGVRWTMPSFSDATWYHACAVFDGSVPDQHLYIDGALYTTGKTVITAVQAALQDGLTVPWVIGARRATDAFTTAAIDEVCVWNEVLSAGSVSAVYNGGTPFGCTGVDSWWRMGDGDTFTTLLDGPGTNDCTMTNMEAGDIQTEAPP